VAFQKLLHLREKLAIFELRRSGALPNCQKSILQWPKINLEKSPYFNAFCGVLYSICVVFELIIEMPL
jgi:hypothetical protein